MPQRGKLLKIKRTRRMCPMMLQGGKLLKIKRNQCPMMMISRLRWLRRAVRKLAAIYMAALAGPPASSSCPAWVGVEPCFATPFIFVPNAPRFL
uniref:Uncharacterized protein n=1 Tax=Aegilops tauschii TaxID=37682 RepID=M8AHA5_AEGTA